MKVLILCVAGLVALSVASNHRGPICYDGCSLVTSLKFDTNDIMRFIGYGEKPGHPFKKCGTYWVKYCKAGETCNTLAATVTGKVQIGTSKNLANAGPEKDGEMAVTHTHCGPSGEDQTKFCDVIKRKVEEDVQKLSEHRYTNYLAKDLDTQCEQNIDYCDGTNKKCVDLERHPEWVEPAETVEPVKPKDPHEQESHGDAPKICTLLLAYPFLAFMN